MTPRGGPRGERSCPPRCNPSNAAYPPRCSSPSATRRTAMTDPWVVLAVTSGLIALSALFVAIEFALLTARRHRLEDAAAKSRSARAALRSTSELSLRLAAGYHRMHSGAGRDDETRCASLAHPAAAGIGCAAVACRRGRLRVGARDRHLPAPRGR